MPWHHSRHIWPRELWHDLGNENFVMKASYPAINEKYLVDDDVQYPISINGKTRAKLTLPKAMSAAEVEQAVLASDEVQKYLAGMAVKKVIVVPGRIVNLVAV